MSKSILIVDDSSAIRAATRTFVEGQLGLVVCGEAKDGFDAIEKTRELKPDLVILDFQMPRMNGIQAARKIHDLFARVHIILFTMFADSVSSEEASQAGIDVVVSKTNLPALQQGIEFLL